MLRRPTTLTHTDQVTAIVPVAGLSMTDTLNAVRRDAERLGITGLLEIVDAQLARKGGRRLASKSGEVLTNGVTPDLSHGVVRGQVAFLC